MQSRERAYPRGPRTGPPGGEQRPMDESCWQRAIRDTRDDDTREAGWLSGVAPWVTIAIFELFATRRLPQPQNVFLHSVTRADLVVFSEYVVAGMAGLLVYTVGLFL